MDFFSRFLILLLLIFFVISCASIHPIENSCGGYQNFSGPEREVAQGPSTEEAEALPGDLEEGRRDSESEDEEIIPPQITSFAIEKNKDVERWIDYFTKEQANRERFQRFLNRGQRYKKVVQTILKENDLPPELYYLAMIESGYATNAYSRASAVGAWQFMSATGRRYDLESSYYVDERRDPIRSTEAAVKYLTDLYMAFQSWPLAISAYNAGEYRILGAIIRGKSRDFWELADKKLLPMETRNYVPKFMAAVLIGENAKEYGFVAGELEADEERGEFPSVSAVEVPSPVYLKDIAALASMPVDILTMANPHLTRGITPPHVSAYEIWVPAGSEEQIEKIKDRLVELKIKNAKQKFYYPQENKNYHIVKKGDTLSSIARKYQMTIRHLKALNNLKSSRIMAGRKLRISTKNYKSN